MTRNTIKTAVTPMILVALTFAAANCSSFAETFAQKHPRRAEVRGRDRNINRRINADRGHLGGQYGHLEHQDRSIARQQRQDARANGGYLTKGQQGQLNREENSLGKETYFDNKNNKFVQNHPRRSQVLGRDANLNSQINKDQGHLGGNYSNLEHQDRSISRQEQQDARANGGHITSAEQSQLNQEESNLRNQINQDNK